MENKEIKFNKETLFRLLEKRREPTWLTKNRLKSLIAFNACPFPTSKDEEWRRTNISQISFGSYDIVDGFIGAGKTQLVESLKKNSGIINFSGHRLARAEVQRRLAEQGVIYQTLSQAADEHPLLVQKFFLAEGDSGKFPLMNQTFWSHGVFLYIPERLEISAPFILQLEEKSVRAASFPRILVLLEKGARAYFRVQSRNLNDGEIFRNAVSHIFVGAGASLKYVENQCLNNNSLQFSHVYMRLEKEAELLALNANIGSALTKSQFETHLAGTGANAKLLGIYFSGQRQHIDLRTVQFHEAPKATSLLLYKGAVKENAHAIYQGLIKVHKDAQQTDAYQSNKNLVLNDKARADSIPSLEIEANDVKCSHGATVGRVNKEELFYLMSRGISFPEAQRLIISGFFEDVLKEAPEDIQEELRQQIENELGD